jgi:hypothetical protein
MAAAVLAGGSLALLPASAAATSPGDLCLFGTDVSKDTGYPMMPGTSPAIAELSGGNAEVAFQNSGEQLNTYVDSSGAYTSTDYAMDPASSPDIASAAGKVDVVFNAAGTHALWTGSGSTETPSAQILVAGTSPAVAVESSGATDYAYLAANLDVVEGNGSAWTTYHLGAHSGSSAAIAALDGGGWEVSFEANTTDLYYLNDKGTSTHEHYGMSAGASPAIAGLGTSGDFETAWEANTDKLYNTGSVTNADVADLMAANTNAAITPVGAAGWEIAFQGSNGDLWIEGTDGTMDTGHAMAPGTSPTITVTKSGYETAYQCAAPPPPVTTTATTTTTTTTVLPAPVTSTTPASPPPPATKKSGPRIRAQFTFRITWNGRTSHIYAVKVGKKLPRAALVTFSCKGTKRYRCPKLGTLAKRKRTLAKELAVVAGRTFTHNDVLTITTSAKGYSTERIAITLSGRSRPRFKLSWK